MPSTTLQINVIPKRMLTRAEAAHHCGRSTKKFEAECPCAPVVFPNGDKLFDINDLDAWINCLKAGTRDSGDDIVARLG